MARPEKPCPWRFDTAVFGHPCHHFAETASTNSLLKTLAGEGAPQGTVVTADYQTAGRGQRRADWQSPAGENMLISLLCRPELHPQTALRFTLATALILRKALVTFGPTTELARHIKLKWPNDLIGHGKKLAGILLESIIRREKVEALIVGVGLNLNSDFSLPGLRDLNAVSCRDMLGREIDRPAFVAHFVKTFELCYFDHIKNKLNSVTSEWERYAIHRDRAVAVQSGRELYRGDFDGLDEQGFLRLRLAHGAHKIITNGKVVAY